MKEEHINELSWLNENSISSSSSSSRAHEHPSRTTLLPKVESNVSNSNAKSNVPSWALEDNSVDEDDTKSYESKDTRRSIQPINVKWKNKKGQPVPAEIHSGSTPKDDDEEEDWRCFPSDPILACFQCFHFTSGVNGLLALVSNAYVYTLHDLPIYDLVLHGYAIVFCLLIVFVELDWRYIVSKVKYLDLWVLRGLFYVFVGVITANNMRSQSIEHVAVTSQRVMGIVLCSYGGCYVLMALFCLKSVKEHRMRMQYEQYMEIDDR